MVCENEELARYSDCTGVVWYVWAIYRSGYHVQNFGEKTSCLGNSNPLAVCDHAILGEGRRSKKNEKAIARYAK